MSVSPNEDGRDEAEVEMSNGSGVDGSRGIPFWNVNLPLERHTKECPSYLQYAFQDHKDREILSTLDKDFKRHTWEEVKQIVHGNQLDRLVRVPSDLRRYREYCAKLAEQYGTVMNFIVNERLQWRDLTPKGRPFECADDLKILYNDFPYGIDTRIAHLVVWTKFGLAPDPSDPKGDLLPEVRSEIDEFVNETFVRRCGSANVIWFKNWSALKSIHAVEHFHVMLFNPDPEFLKDITGGDVPLVEKVGKP